MGRLLEALRAEHGTAQPAILAILEAEPIADAAHNRRIAEIAEGAKPTAEVEPSPCDPGDPEQTGRLLAALRDECLADYTQTALRESCGPVWLWQGAPPRLKGCPWCFHRKAGKSFARPAS